MRPASSARSSSSWPANGRLQRYPPDAERLVGGDEVVGRGQVGFREAQQRLQARVVGGHQESVDEPRARRRIGQCGDDHELLGVGHDDPLARVVILGRAPQHGDPRQDAHHPGKGSRLTGDVTS